MQVEIVSVDLKSMFNDPLPIAADEALDINLLKVGGLEAAVQPQPYGDGKRYAGHLMTFRSNEQVYESIRKYD